MQKLHTPKTMFGQCCSLMLWQYCINIPMPTGINLTQNENKIVLTLKMIDPSSVIS